MRKNTPLSYIEISKAAVIHNIKQFKKLLPETIHMTGVVKANAYGHGDAQMVRVAAPHVDYFQVNSIEELERIRKITRKQVLVFGYVVGGRDIARAINLGCILAVFDLEHALLIHSVARSLDRKQKVHIAVDSCLGREGIMPSQIEIFISEIKKMKYLVVDGVYSHFANIEDTTDFSHAQKQIDVYKEATALFEKHGFTKIKKHISATSGALVWEVLMNKDIATHTARIGIGMYGMWPSTDLCKKYENQFELKPVIRWVTHIAQVKVLPKGHTIGYGLTYVTTKEMRIAVIPQGYSDGIDRSLSNKGSVLIGGMRAPILGRVMMNMMVVDVSHIELVSSLDEVVILGAQGADAISAEEIAALSDTINYEVTTKISPLLPRIIV